MKHVFTDDILLILGTAVLAVVVGSATAGIIILFGRALSCLN